MDEELQEALEMSLEDLRAMRSRAVSAEVAKTPPPPTGVTATVKFQAATGTATIAPLYAHLNGRNCGGSIPTGAKRVRKAVRSS